MNHQLHQFKDAAGRIWSLKVNVGNYTTIRDDYGVDITNITEGKTSWMSTLADDMTTFVGILVELTNKERTSRELSLEEFIEGLEGDVLVEATDAVLQAAVNFLPAHHRLAFMKVLEKIRQGQKMMGEKVADEVDHLFQIEDLETQLDKVIASHRGQSTS